MKKTLRFFILLLFLSSSVVGWAQLKYSFSYLTGVLTISGNGHEIDPFEINKEIGRLYSFVRDKTVKSIDLSGITILESIGKSAFSDLTELTQIPELPSSLKSIGYGAFSRCGKMAGKLIFPASLTAIDAYAFTECNSLTEVIFPPSLISLDTFTFKGCGGLISADFSKCNTLTSIGNGTFSGCSKLTTVSFPPSLISIDDVAFSYCSKLILPSFPKSVTTIGKAAFALCGGLNGILKFPPSLKIIDENAFGGCHGLTAIDFSNCIQLTNIENLAFSACDNIIGNIKLPASIISIGDEVFSGCSRIISIDFTECTSLQTIGGKIINNSNITSLNLSPCTALTIIGNNAFFNNTTLTSIDISGCSSLTTIGNYAFCNSGITGSLNLPKNLTEIGKSAFGVCIGINGQLVLPKTLVSIGESAFIHCTGIKGMLQFPPSLQMLSNEAFKDCNGITGVDFSQCNRLTSIGNDAFNNCNGITSLDFSQCTSLKNIGGSTFVGCTYLNKLILSPDLTSIGNAAFLGCNRLSGTLTLPPTLLGIGDYAFSGCNSLTGELKLPVSLTMIGQKAFSGCTRISLLRCLRSTPPAISTNTFENTNIEFCFVPEGTAGDYKKASGWVQFMGNWNVIDKDVTADVNVSEAGTLGPSILQQSANHPKIVTRLTIQGMINEDDYAYMRTNMPLLYSVNMKGCNVTSIPDEAFKNSKVLFYQYPAYLSTVGNSAFSGCSGLNTLFLPATLKSIGATAFSGCNQIDTIYSTATTPPTLGNDVFKGIDKEKCKLVIPKGTSVLTDYFLANQWSDFINFIQSDFPTSLFSVRNDDLKIYGIENTIIIEGVTREKTYTIYDTSGIIIIAGYLTPFTRSALFVPKGIYIVRTDKKTSKVIVQ